MRFYSHLSARDRSFEHCRGKRSLKRGTALLEQLPLSHPA